jgi:tRNA(Ile)-lysidine synthase
MRDRLAAHVAQTRLIGAESRVLVGYSGGADSTCLLSLLREIGFDVVAAHLHHGQRIEADEEMARCQAFCDSLDVPIATGRADVPLIARELGVGLEEAGRHARYEFFRQAASRLGCDVIATAHTRDDLVETVLLNIVRGSGLTGLGGIPAVRGQIVRPLLPFSRAETRAFCDERGYWTHDDPANHDLDFARARIRHRVLPELRAVNARADAAIERLSGMAREEDRFLDGMAAAALEQSEMPLNGPLAFLTKDCEVAFRRDALMTLPRVLLRRAFRLAFGALGAEIEYDHAEALVDGVAGHEKGSVTAPGGEVVAEWAIDVVHMRLLAPTEPFRHVLTVPGETISDEFGWALEVRRADPGDYRRDKGALAAVIDEGRAAGSLYFRSTQPGDAIQPLGMSGTRKLGDLFGEAGLTEAARRRLPIVCDLVGPVWAPGLAMSDRLKITPETTRALELRLTAR